MSTELARYDETLLARLNLTAEQAAEMEAAGITLEEYAQLDKAAAEMEANAELVPVRIKIAQAGIFQNEATGEIYQTLKVRVPYSHTSRVLFVGDADSDEAQAPACSSHDGVVGRYADEDGVLSYRDCAACPFAQWGSDPKTGKGQACKLMRRLFVLTEDSAMPAVLNLPPSSLRTWNRFVSAIKFRGQLLSNYEIELSLEVKRNGAVTWAQIKPPTALRVLSPVERAAVLKIGKDIETEHERVTVSIQDYLGVDLPDEAEDDTSQASVETTEAPVTQAQ